MKQGQFPAVIQLSSLNGQNGFKIDGEMMGDFYYVSNSFAVAEDINGDGRPDVVIGAGGHGNYMGRTYVIFGGPGVGSQGVLALSALNGGNGFKLDGEATEDNAGFSVSTVGDFNGDGYHDFLIGAPQTQIRYIARKRKPESMYFGLSAMAVPSRGATAR